jgi:antitoxin ParD1/3/4
MNVSLTPELEKFVADTVATGRYNSASEVVREGLRKLEEQERWRILLQDKLTKGLEDLAAGRIVDGETAMRRIRAAAQSKKATRKAS